MIRFPHSLVAVLLLSLSTSPLLAQDGPTTTERPMYGAEFEFAGRGNRIPLWENQRFENYRAIMAVVAEHYGGRASDITKAEWTVPHPSGEGERKLFRAEYVDPRGRRWLLEPEYVATRGLDGYEFVTPPLNDASEIKDVLDKIRGSGLVREGLKSGVHIHVDGKRLVTPAGNATGLINLINMHENYEPLLRRLFNPVRGGGDLNRFAQPLYLNHSELLNEINNLSEAERTPTKLESIFKRHVETEMRVHNITELDATSWKKMWKYNSLNLKNILNINEVLPAEIGTVEFRMNDLASAETHRLEIELYRRMVEHAAELAAEGKVVKYERASDFRLAEGITPSRELTPLDPAEASTKIREMIERLGMDPAEFERLIEKNVRPRFTHDEREVRERVENLTRGRVLHDGAAFTYGFELEGRGAGFAEIARPIDAEMNARWDAMSSGEKRAYYERVVGENHREVKTHFKLDLNRFGYLDGTMKIEGSGNWEIRSNVFESVGEATDRMREVKRLTGRSAKGFHLHMRDNAPNWEAMKRAGPEFADFIDRAGYWVWLQRVLSKRTDLSLKSWSNAPFTPGVLEGIAGISDNRTSNHARHTMRVARDVGGTNNIDVEIRGLTLDVNRIETLAKIVTENLRTTNFGPWRHTDNLMPHGGGHGDAPPEIKFNPHMEEYLRAVEGRTFTPEMRVISENLQKRYPDLSGKNTRALPSNLGVPLLPWDAETSLSEPMRRTMTYAREEYLRRVLSTIDGVQNGKYGFDINVASEALLAEKLGLNPAEIKAIVEARRLAASQPSSGWNSSSNEIKSAESLAENLARSMNPDVNLSEVNISRANYRKLMEAGLNEADAKRVVRIRNRAAERFGNGLIELDYNRIERASRGHVRKWAEETRIDRVLFDSLLPRTASEVGPTDPRNIRAEGEGFARRRTAPGVDASSSRISNAEMKLVFEDVRSVIATRAAAREGGNPARAAEARLEVVSSSELVMEYDASRNRVRVSTATLNELHTRSLERPPGERRGFRRNALGILFGHELAHSGGLKAERSADIEAIESLKTAKRVAVIDGVRNPVTERDIKSTIALFERPTGSRAVDNIMYRLRNLPRYGTTGGRATNMARAARGEADPLSKYRRADGTLNWKRVTTDKALTHTAGVAHFALALFLKEMAVVVKTGDKARIEEFFDGLMTTDFFVTYGLFSAGAHAGNVAFSRYLDKYIKPRFVSSVLRTNLVLATGMALPEIYHGTFSGKAFAINVASLGLSTVAVKAGLEGISWVVNLRKTSTTGRMARAAASMRRFAKIGGWFYTAAETAVVLYLGDELAVAVNKYLDDRAAKNAIADASMNFFGSTRNKDLTVSEFQEALDRFSGAHVNYRNYLYKPLIADDEIYYSRLSKAAREAKLLADKRKSMLDRLKAYPALRATVVRKYGSVDAYEAALASKDEAEIDRKVNMYMESYNRSREANLKEIYGGNRRGTAYMNDRHALWLARGGRAGAVGDPYGGRDGYYERMGRSSLKDDFRDSAYEVSSNRIEAYSDEIAALRLAARATPNEHHRSTINERIGVLSEMQKADAKLGDVTSVGAAGALRREQ